MKLIAVHVAMKEEGLGFAERLGLKEIENLDPEMGFREFHGKFGSNLEVRLFLQGTDQRFDVEQIGLEAAAACAALYINRYRPNLILNFGTAGAFTSAHFSIGEVLVVKDPIKFHDRRVPLKGYFESAEGRHPVADYTQLNKVLRLREGILSSGSSLEMTARDAEILKDHSATLKEMEAAAIAWVAEKKKIPFVALKSVTDFIDAPEKAEDQFLANLHAASVNVQKQAVRVIEFLDQNVDDPIWKF